MVLSGQINSVKGYTLGINKFYCTHLLKGKYNVWSPNGYPTTSIKYAYNGTLTAVIDSNVSVKLKQS